MKFLENDIIRLRAPEYDDIDLLYKWENNSELWQIGETLAPFSRQVLTKYLESAHLDLYEARQLRLMITLANENRVIGSIDLFDFEPHHSRAGIGILIADTTDRKKGYANEALKLTVNYCFELLGLHQLYCNIGVSNSLSLQLFFKNGFDQIGIKKQWSRKANVWEDEYLLQLLNPAQS